MIKASQLLHDFSDLLQGSIDEDIVCTGIGSPNCFTHGNVIVCNNEQALISVADNSETKPSLIITSSDFVEAGKVPANIPILTSHNTRLAHALIKQRLNDYDNTDSEWDRIHSSATIHPSAKIASSCRIGPHVVIGANVIIGEHSIVRSNSVIEHDSVIGKNSCINSLVNVGYGSKIGDRVIVRSGVAIGNEGFGWAPDDDNHYHRVPHTGYVEIHDDVQIGANSNIDRGTYGPTVIKRGAKIDALCHVAHNVVIGEDCILVSQSGVAGSSTLGSRVIVSGQTGILDHITIADDVTLVHRAGVTADITEKGMWAGKPHKPLKEYVKQLNSHKRLEKKLAQLEQRIAQQEKATQTSQDPES